MKSKTLLVMALAIGLLSALLVYNYLSAMETTTYVEMIDVVVANRTIPANTVVTNTMLAWKRVPVDSIHEDAVQTLPDAQGRIAASQIIAGEQILHSRLLPAGEVPGLSFTIPADKRAVTIAVNEVIGVAGFIKPGDKIDVIATFSGDQPLAKTVLENVTVLAIAQDMEAEQKTLAQVSTSVTFALTPNQSEKLLLAEAQGTLRLALRSPQAVGVASHQGVTAEDLHPIAANRQQITTSTPSSGPANQLKVIPKQSEIAPPQEKRITVEVIRGTKQEVQQVNE